MSDSAIIRAALQEAEKAPTKAAAIEAFLRALEDGTIWRPNPFLDNRPVPNETLHQLAAAVAHAAQEGRS